MKYLLPLMLCLAGCNDDDSAAYVPWSPEVTPVEDTAAVKAPVVPADCSDVDIERWRYRYENGRLVEAARTGNGDRVELLHYDRKGRFIGVEMVGAQGFATVTLRYDDVGALIARVVDSSDDGMDSRMELISHSIDQRVVDYDGAVLFLPFSPVEGPSIPKPVCTALQETGIRGEVMLDELVRRVEAGESIADFDPFRVREVRTFDGEGRLLRTTWDLRRDGVFDLVETVQHETLADGRREVILLARRRGGEARRIERTFDANDRLVHEVAGGITRNLSWLDDQTVGQELRVGPEGTWIRTVTREAGLQRTTVDQDGDGTPEHVTNLFLREDGQRVLKQEDYDADGIVDWQKRYFYRADAKRVYEERNRAVDGDPDQRWEYLYDPMGRVVWEVITEPGDARCAGIRP